ncbi:hypothetical protein B0H11DRAFT_2343833 [Mycena galericulata]|nr:hypothetical protein B0H11DRAFT_2343833 [Mycena galericulata]
MDIREMTFHDKVESKNLHFGFARQIKHLEGPWKFYVSTLGQKLFLNLHGAPLDPYWCFDGFGCLMKVHSSSYETVSRVPQREITILKGATGLAFRNYTHQDRTGAMNKIRSFIRATTGDVRFVCWWPEEQHWRGNGRENSPTGLWILSAKGVVVLPASYLHGSAMECATQVFISLPHLRVGTACTARSVNCACHAATSCAPCFAVSTATHRVGCSMADPQRVRIQPHTRHSHESAHLAPIYTETPVRGSRLGVALRKPTHRFLRIPRTRSAGTAPGASRSYGHTAHPWSAGTAPGASHSYGRAPAPGKLSTQMKHYCPARKSACALRQ